MNGEILPGKLVAIGPSIWVARVPFKVMGIDLGNCMTVMQLSDKSVLLHSPNKFDESYCRELDAIGPVRHLFAPNYMHNLFFAEWKKRYPDARIYAPDGIKIKNVDVDVVLSKSKLVEIEKNWTNDLDMEWVGGIPRVNEIVFYHKPSSTIIFTDLAFNVRNSSSWRTRIAFSFYGNYGKFGPTKLITLLIKDRSQYQCSVDRFLSWDVKTIVVSHGEMVTTEANRVLQAAFISR